MQIHQARQLRAKPGNTVHSSVTAEPSTQAVLPQFEENPQSAIFWLIIGQLIDLIYGQLTRVLILCFLFLDLATIRDDSKSGAR
jgi:hypothetical protein